jgi:hypothetical protein
MRRHRRALPVAVIPVLVAVAVLGYLVGRTHNARVRTASVVLDYPPGWHAVAAGVRIPNLAVAQPVAIGPGGSGARAGLLVGALAPGELAPLPGRFVSKLRQVPTTEVVNLLEVQAYRYTHLSVPGFARALTIFVIPDQGGRPTALACYAPSSSSGYMRACEHSVAALAVTGPLEGSELTPDPAYAAAISAAISRLDALRVSLKQELKPAASAATAQRLADRLAKGYSAAARSLAGLEPSAQSAPVQTALGGAIARAQVAYTALAAAAGEQDVTRYEAAQRKISSAEAEVDEALAIFALIGYDTARQSAH